MTNYDVARQKLGGDWQIPTKEIWEKLHDISEFDWTFENNGCKVKTKDGSKSIFLPAAGHFDNTSCNSANTRCDYWSSTARNTIASGTKIENGSFNVDYGYGRYYGLSIRPVRLVEVDN